LTTTVVGRPRQRFCYRGHDTNVVGRARTGNCRECKREDNRARNHGRYVRNYAPSVRVIRVPTEPLRAFIKRDDRRIKPIWSQTNYERYVWRPYVSLKTADEIACSLGVHPYEIWGWDWFAYGTYSLRQILASEGVGL
jgi:hypothetical protein